MIDDVVLLYGKTKLPADDCKVIFKDKFKKELESSYEEINVKVKDVQTADSMTDNQVKAWARDYFKT